MTKKTTNILSSLLFLLLGSMLSAAPLAATYTLPSSIGSGPFANCSLASSTNYNCTGNINIGNNDAVNFASSLTLNISGNFSLGNNSTLNSGGHTANIVTGGNISIGNSLTGSINFTAGGNFQTGNSASIVGNISAGGNIDLGNNANVTGNVSAGGNLNVGNGSVINGTCTYASTNYICNTPPAISISNASVSESNSSTVTLIFNVSLSKSSTLNTSVNYATSNGTASGGGACSAGTDYITTSGTLTIPAGTTTGTIAVTVCGDTLTENDETLSITLSNPVNTTIATATATGTILDDDPLAHWRMDESTWNGTSNEVIDSSGNGYHGRAKIAAGSTALPTTASPNPAYTSGSQSTCNYGVFDSTTGTIRRYTYVELSGFPTLPSSFTFTAWIRSNNATAQHQRILVRDDADNGWGLSLADGTGQGKLRFFNRNISNSGSVSGQGSNPSCGVFCLDTNPVITSNNWYFIAAAIDTTAKTITLYVYNSGGALLAKTSSAFSGTWKDGTGTAAIGGETSASSEGTQPSWHFLGNIDEVQIYRGAQGQTNIESMMRQIRYCPSIVNHYEVTVPASNISCLESTVSIKACADTSSPCTNVSIAMNGVATLTTNAGTLGTTTPAFANGVASTTLRYTGANDGDSAILSLSGESTAATSARTCCIGGSCSTSDTCSATFNTAGLIFSSSSTGNIATLPTQTAGTTSGNYYLRAVKSNTATGACISALSGTQSIGMAYRCNDPTSCSSSNLLTIDNGIGTTAIQRNDNSPPITYQPLNLTFDSNGSAPFSFTYGDVGRITLYAQKAANSNLLATLNGSSNPFVVKPYDFLLSSIKCSDGTSNPGALDATGAKFCKAGANFSVTVTARNAQGTATPNYGNESTGETVRLTPTLVSGLGLTNNPSISNATGFGSFSSGSANGTTFGWSEVGIITLTPGVGDSDYLGAGDVTGTTSGNIGRFYPNHFVLSSATLTPAHTTFTYMEQAFDVAFTLTAAAASGSTTQNYVTSSTATNNFAKLDPSTSSLWPASTIGTTGFALGARNGSIDLSSRIGTTTTPTGTWSNGIANITTKLSLARTSTPDGPFDNLDIGVAPRDSDGTAILSTAFDLDADNNSSNERKKLGQTKVRFGRLRLSNAFGPAQGSIGLAIQAQYWSGNSWVLNSADNSTALLANAFFLTGGIAATTTASGLTLSNGQGTLLLTNTGGAGSVDIAVNLGNSGSDQSCLGSHGGTAANRPWLRARNGNCATTYDRDPSARATFGIYAPETRRSVHVQELF